MTIRRIRRGERGYPMLLARIPDPPPSLWVRGDADLGVLADTAVAIVGARACSGYGRTVARMLASGAAAAGAVVVSGLARGIDGEAHRGALAASGRTVAVLGCGADRDYPAAHAALARGIVAGGGLVVSEYEPGVEPAPWRFPARKRDCSATMRIWLNHAVARALRGAKHASGVVSVWSRENVPLLANQLFLRERRGPRARAVSLGNVHSVMSRSTTTSRWPHAASVAEAPFGATLARSICRLTQVSVDCPAVSIR